ncbi:MAG: ANTAR domain-containing protein [Oscillospiraceae bacterium]|nr:ANTAR domain-containing protein [Oscillospiraceae bacterium]
MALEERSYSLLLVSAGQKLNQSLRGLLPGSIRDRLVVAPDAGAAKRAVASQTFDFVIVNAPLPDEPGIRFAIDQCTAGETVVLLLLRPELFPQVTETVCEHGVFTLSKPLSYQAMETALLWMASARERLRKTRRQALTLEEKMAEIRLVNRAKWFLIEHRHMDEPSAHRYIEKQAMDRCITRRAVAEELLGLKA